MLCLRYKDKHFSLRYTFTMVTDGPFDMGRFLYLQTRHLGMKFPYSYASTWANLRKCFANFYKGDFYKGSSSSNGSTNRLPGLQTMLDMLGMYYLTIFGLEDDLYDGPHKWFLRF